MNKFIGIGRLTKEIELKQTTSGKTYMQNTIAIRNDYKNANGEYDSEYINVVFWGKMAEFLTQYATKGMRVAIEGRTTTRSYTKQDGTKGYITEIICNGVELLDSRKKEETTQTDSYDSYDTDVDVDDNFLD